MTSFKSGNILLLAKIFEQMSEKQLFSFAQEFNLEEELPEPTSDNKHNLPYLIWQFSYSLANFLHSSVSEETTRDWYEKNKAIAKDIIPFPWDTDLDFENKTYYLYLKDKTIRIYREPIQTLSESKSIFIPGYKEIPNLWLYTGVVTKPEYESSPKFSHYDFIYSAMQELAGDTEDVEQFIKKNNNVINKIRGSFGTQTPILLGKGADGVAYDIGNNLILKIFKDKYAFDKAKEAQDRLHKNPELAKTEAMIYDAAPLGVYDRVLYYYYIIEKMKPLSNLDNSDRLKLKSVFAAIINYIMKNQFDDIRGLRKQVSNGEDLASINKTVQILVNNVYYYVYPKIEKFVEVLEKDLDLKSSWVKSYIEEVIVKFISGRTDLHMGNIGRTNYGELRYFDPAYSRAQNDINFPYESNNLKSDPTTNKQ